MPEPGGPGATAPPPPPPFLADQLTLFQPEGADSAHRLLLTPPKDNHSKKAHTKIFLYNVSFWSW
jgi:hypothetical protein